MGPWPSDRFTEDEQRTSIDVRDLTDVELASLARYRGTLAANTIAGHPDHERAVSGLRAVYAEIERRQQSS
jgi:hypothetical protein